MNPFRKDKKQLSIFLTSGFPELSSLPKQISFLEQSGIDFIEVGIPFSDPMADGPTIQESSDIALSNGMNIELMFEQLSGINCEIPLVIMSYFNPILHFGLGNFLQHCSDVGVKHLILPDISLEVYEHLYQDIFESNGVSLCFLITPRTSPERIKRMSEHSSSGFIYLVSSSMTTGSAAKQLEHSEFKQIREACGDTPIMIGFGIRNKQNVKNVHKIADGAIIGSAFIKALKSGEERTFISQLLELEPQNL